MYNIDSFQKPNSTVFITHAHHDHLKGRHKKTCHVICTPTTRRLLGHIFPYKIKITTHAYFEVFEAANQAAVFLPSFHMPGSAMVFFIQPGILHVGDHIPTPKFWYYFNMVISKLNNTIKEVHMDATFHAQAQLISYPETSEILQEQLNRLFEKQKIVSIRVYNLSVIPILSSLAYPTTAYYIDTDSFSPNSSIPAQFAEMGISLQKTALSKFKLTRSDKEPNCVILSALWYLCTLRKNTGTLGPVKDGTKIRICYATHARHCDNVHLVQRVKYHNPNVKVVYHGRLRANLLCKK